MVLIVDVHVFVLGRSVRVQVLVPVSQEQSHTRGHQTGGRELPVREGVAEEHDRDDDARERRRREHRCFARRAQRTQRVGVEEDARAVADRAQCERGQEQTERRHVADLGGARRRG